MDISLKIQNNTSVIDKKVNRKFLDDQLSNQNEEDTLAQIDRIGDSRSLIGSPLTHNYRSIINTPASPLSIDYETFSDDQFKLESEDDNDKNHQFLKRISAFFQTISHFYHKYNPVLNHLKIVVFLVYGLVAFFVFSSTKEKDLKYNQIIIKHKAEFHCENTEDHSNLTSSYFKLAIQGLFLDVYDSANIDILTGESVKLSVLNKNLNLLSNWTFIYDQSSTHSVELENVFELNTSISSLNDLLFRVESKNNLQIPFSYACSQLSDAYRNSTLYTALLVIFTYGLIIFEVFHRTIAAALGSMGGLALIALINNERPGLEEVISWIEWETILLMFGMMVIVAVFFETGFFDLIAVRIFHYSANQLWVMIGSLCLLSCVLSAFLDNVTTILLLTPITIRLCEVMSLNPVNILIGQVIFSNIGGAATAIGDPPNVIITANSEISKSGINFANFTTHMMVGSIFVCIVAFMHFKFLLSDPANFILEPVSDLDEMKKEIKIWKRSYLTITPLTKEEKLVRTLLKEKVSQLENLFAQKLSESKVENSNTLREKSQDLVQSVKITNKVLLFKSASIFSFAIVLFFLHPFLDKIHLSIGWISIFSALLLLVASSDKNSIDFESVLHKIEWSVLSFFVALFIFMECVNELGLLNYIAEQISNWINSVNGASDRLAFALMIMVIVSAVVSSIIDNIPFTTAMIPIVLQLSKKSQVLYILIKTS